MFQPLHLLVLLSTFLLVPTICVYLERKNEAVKQAFFRGCAIIVILFDPIYWIWEIQRYGSPNLATALPLYICSLFWILLPVAAFAKKQEVRQIAMSCLSSICLLAGVFGLVFNVYLNQYPFFSFVPLRSLLYHFLMILTGSVMWTSKLYVPQRGDCLRAMIPVLILLIPCLVLNRYFGWDYCYTAGGIGTPLEQLSLRMSKPIFLAVVYGGLFSLNGILFFAGISPVLSLQKKAAQRCERKKMDAIFAE